MLAEVVTRIRTLDETVILVINYHIVVEIVSKLTIHNQHYAFADRRRHPVGRYAQIRSHVKATDPCQIQDWPFNTVHCNTHKKQGIITLSIYIYTAA